MSKEVKSDGNKTPSGPFPPFPVPPTPPIELKTVYDLLKIVAFVVVWYVATDANRALSGAVNFDKLAETTQAVECPFFGTSVLPAVTWTGAKIGLLQGLIVAVQALVTVWAGPTLFVYLGPVLTSAFMVPIKLLGDIRKAWNGSTTDPKKGDGDHTGNKDKDKPEV